MYVAHLGGNSSTHGSHPFWPDSRRQWVGPAAPIFSWESASASPLLPGSPGPTWEGQASTTGARQRPPPSPVEASLSLYRQHRLYPRVQGLLWRQRGDGVQMLLEKGPLTGCQFLPGRSRQLGPVPSQVFLLYLLGGIERSPGGQSSTSTPFPPFLDRQSCPPLPPLSFFCATGTWGV